MLFLMSCFIQIIKMITIVDYKVGNLGSIANMLKKIGVKSQVTSDRNIIEMAEKLILPGVGAFDNGMNNLTELGLVEILNKKVLGEKVPILGICLGTQLFTKGSEEGNKKGLGWLDADTVKFDVLKLDEKLKIPNMGWNFVKQKKESRLFEGMYPEPKFYFVHAYHLLCHVDENRLADSVFGYSYCSAIERDNIVGVQFHPEKSHKYGMKLLKNFADNY
jgi:glutamine amidotransferase